MLVLTSAEQMEAALARAVVPVEVVRASRGFRGSLARREFGDGVAVVDARARPHVLARTPQLIGASAVDGVVLEVNVRGSTVLTQHGRDAVLRTGDGALFDSRAPYRLELPEENAAYLVHVPREQVALSDATLRRAMARRIHLGLASYQLLRGYLDLVFPLAGLSADVEGRALVGRTLADLATSITSAVAGDRAAGSRETLLCAMQVTIRRELADPDLTPSLLARRHHVSLRSVHAAFELTSATPAAYIRERRLERARRLLANPDLPILDVALRCGFRGSSTFVRAFRAAHGMAPSEFRALLGSAGAPV